MIVYSLDKLFFMFAFSPIQLSHEFTSPLLLLLLSPFPLLGKMCSSPRISQAAFCCCCCNRLYQLSQLKQVTQYRENSKERGRRRSQLVLSQQIERSCYCCSCYPTEAFTIQEPQNPSIDFSKQQKSTGFGGSKLEKKCSVRYCFPALSILAPSVFLVLHVLLLQAAASRSMAAVLSKRSFLLHQHIEQKCCKPPSVVVYIAKERNSDFKKKSATNIPNNSLPQSPYATTQFAKHRLVGILFPGRIAMETARQ